MMDYGGYFAAQSAAAIDRGATEAAGQAMNPFNLNAAANLSFAANGVTAGAYGTSGMPQQHQHQQQQQHHSQLYGPYAASYGQLAAGTASSVSLDNLEVHLWACHIRSFPYRCAKCGYPALNSKALITHFSESHDMDTDTNSQCVEFKRRIDHEIRLRELISRSLIFAAVEDGTDSGECQEDGLFLSENDCANNIELIRTDDNVNEALDDETKQQYIIHQISQPDQIDQDQEPVCDVPDQFIQA
ncbi:unnamed protein product [Anisakis simplex]|uniref:C2H2-type domain-containing protein n=1 Tax=Anisakis simplex TaxID=6269 RepID=A0A0M3KAJ7_ANISI|nr:unnamed protein product [Anisakis simplex]